MKHNSVRLYGKVVEGVNTVHVDNFSIATCKVEVAESFRPCGLRKTKPGKTIVTVFADNESIMDDMYPLRVNDMVEIKGMLLSVKVSVTAKCSHCGETNVQTVRDVVVVPVYVEARERVNEETAEKLIDSRREVSNQITLIGNLLTPPQNYLDKTGVNTTVYTLRNDKKQEGDNYNSIPVKSYGHNAASDAKALEKGSIVFVDGFLKNRKSNHTGTCEACKKNYNWSNVTCEVISYATEYFP